MTNISLLFKPTYDYKDVCQIVGCKTTKAYQVMKICRKQYGGAIKYEPRLITSDSLYLYLGTTREREIGLYENLQKN